MLLYTLCIGNSASGLLQFGHKPEKWQWHDVIVKFFWGCFVSLVNFSYWSKFHVNIITGSEVMTIFFYKGLTRNPEIRNTLVRVLPNILRLGWVRDTDESTNGSNEILLNVAKCQGYSFCCSKVDKEKVTGR